ncbi:hypothetical protein TRIP_B310036 [uncultured Desulfatiglans sp.]|nr:hypothetical protein TRIP_B310036 [uncultured Desulfatiglans sp.]
MDPRLLGRSGHDPSRDAGFLPLHQPDRQAVPGCAPGLFSRGPRLRGGHASPAAGRGGAEKIQPPRPGCGGPDSVDHYFFEVIGQARRAGPRGIPTSSFHPEMVFLANLGVNLHVCLCGDLQVASA